MEYKAKLKGRVSVHDVNIPIETTITIEANSEEEAEAIALKAVKGAYVGWSSWKILQ
jgi:hypothetical protein